MHEPPQIPPQTNDSAYIEKAHEAFCGPFTLSVSIVIPFYKGREILARTLASLINQTYPAHLIEVIITDDGSPEPVLEVIKEFESRLHLRYTRQEDLGFRCSTARNRGIELAQGEVIISLDFDMICPPHLVASHLSWFHVSDRVATIGWRKFVNAQHITIDDVISRFEMIDSLPVLKSISGQAPTGDYDYRTKVFANFPYLLTPAFYFFSCNVAYRRSQALAIGGWDEDYNYHYGYEDIDFGHRLWLSGIFLVAVADAFAYHQENDAVSF
ncbi:MAG TPA: glycosyltransferase, partial [Ktedonobacteraceae bacterium]|nr:glycosyltransferase [Ktedonobacteraceae bacterium]